MFFETPIKFLKLAPLQSAVILIGSIITGMAQAATVFTLVPLMDILGLLGVGDNRFVFILKSLLNFIGLRYSLLTVLLFIVFFTLVIALINYVSESYSVRTSSRLVQNLQKKAIDSVMGAQWSYYTGKKSGDFVHSVVTEAGKASNGFRDSINFFSTVIQGLVILVATFFINVYVAIGSAIIGMMIIYIFKGWVEKARLAGMKSGSLTQSVTATIADGMVGIKPLKTMNRDHLLAPLLISETKKLDFQRYRLFMVSAIPKIFLAPIISFFVAIGLYIIISKSLVPVASVIPLALLFQRTVQQFGATQSIFQSIKKMEPYLEGLEANISKALSVQENWPGKLDPIFDNEIKFKNVDFAYDEKVILNNINLSIRKNEFIVLVGSSGAGKTTIVDLLCGLFTPISGELMIDGVNILDLDVLKWRRFIGYVPQDLFLFHDTIANNVSLGDPNIKISTMEKALQSADAWEFVSALPDGLQTNIGERGLKLSGGQRQRISIARAIVGNPKLLLLDEATTALDPETEQKILTTLRKLSYEGITIIAVSHQTAVLDIVDQAYKLKSGSLINMHKNQ